MIRYNNKTVTFIQSDGYFLIQKNKILDIYRKM